MTESEAIEELKYDCNELGKAIPCDTSWGVLLKMLMEWQYKHLKSRYRRSQRLLTMKNILT